MSDIRSQIKAMLGIKGKSAPHTVYSDLNEGTCFATLCDPPSISNKCIRLILANPNMAISKTVKAGFKAVFTELNTAGFLAAPDKEAFRQIDGRMQTVIAATPKGQQAGGIKIVQGYNEAMFLIDQLKSSGLISESYFTNTAPLLISAVTAAGAPAIASALGRKGWRPNPADILIKIAPLSGGREIIRGVSLKASYGNCAPTICNFGMKGIFWNIKSFGPRVFNAYKAKANVKKQNLLIAASQAVVSGIVNGTKSTPGAAQEFLEAMLHCQPENLPYLFVAAQGSTCYGIDFAKFKERMLKPRFSITTTAKLNKTIGQSLLFSIPDAPPLEFSFRVKRTANKPTDPSLKINVTMTLPTKTWLCNNFPISNTPNQCSIKGGGVRTDMSIDLEAGGMILRSGKQLPPLVSPKTIAVALNELEAAPNELCTLDDIIDDDEPVDSAPSGQVHQLGGSRRRKTHRRQRKKKTKRRRRRHSSHRRRRRKHRKHRHPRRRTRRK